MFLSLSLCSNPVERNAFLKTPDTPIKTNSLVLQQSVSVSDNPLCREIVWSVWLFLFYKIRIIFFSAYTGQITPTNHQELSEKPYYISEIYSHCHLWFMPLFDKNRKYILFFSPNWAQTKENLFIKYCSIINLFYQVHTSYHSRLSLLALMMLATSQ